MNQIFAPWTEEQVENLKAFQDHGNLHPFTCGYCSREGRHTIKIVDIDGEKIELKDHVKLIPTKDGWICPNDDYTQNWAYQGMLDGTLSKPLNFTEHFSNNTHE